jgi:protein-S-isoprenylcysteine O-methyltransferase Ste14
VKDLITSVVPRRLERSVYVWVASLLLILTLLAWRDIGGTIYKTSGWLTGIYAAIQLCGVWTIAAAVRAIDALDLAGIRQEAASHEFHQKAASHDLQTRGVYGIVRHPLYLGWMLAVFGPAQLTGDRLAFAVITSVYLVVAVPWEERSLERAFGDTYVRYKTRVRWRIVPYLY